MAHYTLYLLDAKGHIFARQDHEFKEDLDALEKAQSLCANQDIEVWQGNYRIATVKKDELVANG